MLFKSRQNWKGSSFITRWGEHISFLPSESAQNKDTKIVITDSFCIILQGVQESFGLIRIWYDNIIWIWKWTWNWSIFESELEADSDSNSDSDLDSYLDFVSDSDSYFVSVSFFKSDLDLVLVSFLWWNSDYVSSCQIQILIKF